MNWFDIIWETIIDTYIESPEVVIGAIVVLAVAVLVTFAL